AILSRELIDAQRRPRVNRRVHVTEPELVSGQPAARMHIPLAAEELELTFREPRVDPCHGDAVEREVPCRKPGVLPGVRNRRYIARVEMRPLPVGTALPRGRWWRLGRVSRQPVFDDVVVELPRPDETGIGLPHDPTLVGVEGSI